MREPNVHFRCHVLADLICETSFGWCTIRETVPKILVETVEINRIDNEVFEICSALLYTTHTFPLHKSSHVTASNQFDFTIFEGSQNH